jgi:hypothetical protein
MTSQQQLGAYLAECSGRAFDWRGWNCCHFAAAWVERVTGIDPMAGLPAAASQRGALRLLHRMGMSMVDAVDMRLGFAQVAPEAACIGDIVLIDRQRALGICAGEQAVVLMDGGGIGFLPMAEASHAWRVGAAE